MNISLANVSNIRKYTGLLQVHTPDEERFLVTAIADIPHPLTLHHVVFPPQLSTNLFVGQLVDNSCTISFSSTGSIMKDQVSGSDREGI